MNEFVHALAAREWREERDRQEQERRGTRPASARPAAKLLLWYGDTPPKPPSYLVDETVPEIGVVIAATRRPAATRLFINQTE